jgi:hypothetical protein
MLNFLFIFSNLFLFDVVLSNNILLFGILLLLRRFFTLCGFSFSLSLLHLLSLIRRLSFRILLSLCLILLFLFPRFLIHFFLCLRFFRLLIFSGLRLSLSFCLGLHRFLLGHLGCNLFIILFASFRITAKDLLNVECGINTGCRSSEHLLKEVIRFFWLMTRNNLRRLDVDFFTDH